MSELAAESIEAVRIEIEGMTTSFRYPHLLIGRQPTYPMPPPSTVYGLISAALGAFPDPKGIQFAYRFVCEPERIDDLEVIWSAQAATTRELVRGGFSTEVTSNVLPREWLIHPRMTLYIHGENLDTLHDAFREPRYPPVLGRSQDLVSFRRVDRVQLYRRTAGRFDESLLPRVLRDRVRYGPTVNMPRFIDPEDRRKVQWDWFVVLDQPIPVGPGQLFEPATGDLFWADPDTRSPVTGRERLLVFHSFVRDAEHS
jgi:CRISPR-associated protein Cas5t